MNESGKPLVSVIITTYCNEQYLPRAIESVLHQSYSRIEVIVVDDNTPGSEARSATERIMRRYPQVIYLRHPENRNGAAARNTGIEAASGEYLAFLDNDDMYFSNHIAECVDAIEKDKNCAGVLCGVVKVGEGICWDLILPPEGDFVKALFFSETALGTGSNLFVRAKTVREIEGFDESFLRHQDVEFAIRLFSRGNTAVLNEVQIAKGMDGFSNAPDFKRFLETKRHFMNKFERELGALPPNEQNRYYAGQYSALLYTACKAGDKEKINWTVSNLKRYRDLNIKESLLILLSKWRLFFIYEKLKKIVKKIKSDKIYKKVIKNFTEYDLKIFSDMLKG